MTAGEVDAGIRPDSAPSELADAGVAPPDASAPHTDAASPTADGSADATTGIDAGPLDGGDGLPSTAPCLIGGNVLWVSGDPGSAIYAGMQTVSVGSTWAVSAQDDLVAYDGALLEIHLPNTVSTDPWWFLDFDTENLREPLQTGVVYSDAQPLSQGAGDPGLTIQYARACESGVGSFRVDEFAATGDSLSGDNALVSFTAAFELTCDGNPEVLRGCVHYQQ